MLKLKVSFPVESNLDVVKRILRVTTDGKSKEYFIPVNQPDLLIECLPNSSGFLELWGITTAGYKTNILECKFKATVDLKSELGGVLTVSALPGQAMPSPEDNKVEKVLPVRDYKVQKAKVVIQSQAGEDNPATAKVEDKKE